MRKQGVFVSAGGECFIWLRHNVANFKQRLTTLEKLVAEKGIILFESQVEALERKKEDDITYGEIEVADMLNDKILPFFVSHGLPMLRVLTDRGSEYCGK
ncbi:ISVvu4 transposase [Lonepinella koalarum]